MLQRRSREHNDNNTELNKSFSSHSVRDLQELCWNTWFSKWRTQIWMWNCIWSFVWQRTTFSNLPKCLVSKQTVQNSVDCFLPQKNVWLSFIWRHSWMPTISLKTISEDTMMPSDFSSQLVPGNSSKRLLCFYFRTSVAGLWVERERSKSKNITTDLFHFWRNALPTCTGNGAQLFRKKKDLLGSRLLLAQATNPCAQLFCPLAHFHMSFVLTPRRMF